MGHFARGVRDPKLEIPGQKSGRLFAGGTAIGSRKASPSLAAVFLLLLCVLGAWGPASSAPAGPGDALTLVRQALAALEVTPPAVSVALGKIIQALLARDTRGVDMAHVQEAARALGVQDTAGAVAQLIDALLPAEQHDAALLMPDQPYFTGTPIEYGLLAAAAALLITGALIVRR